MHNISVGWVLNGLLSLHLTLWMLRYVCCTDKGSLPQSVNLPAVLERMGMAVCLRGLPNNAPSGPKLADFWITNLGFGRLGT